MAEQRHTFEWAADHGYLWKPELRIPDVRESADDQRAFARLLRARECSDMRAIGWNRRAKDGLLRPLCLEAPV